MYNLTGVNEKETYFGKLVALNITFDYVIGYLFVFSIFR